MKQFNETVFNAGDLDVIVVQTESKTIVAVGATGDRIGDEGVNFLSIRNDQIGELIEALKKIEEQLR